MVLFLLYYAIISINWRNYNMGQVLTRVVKINGKAEFTKLMDRISAKDNIFDIRRKEYLSKDKFVLNYATKDMVAENTGLFRTTSFARFQTVFTLLNDNEIQIATEYGFIGSASTMPMADKMNDNLAKTLEFNGTKNHDEPIDVDFKEVKKEDSFVSEADKLLKAKELYDKGAISFDEYEQLKRKFMEEALK